MKAIIFALFLAAATPALAQAPRVPTGIDVSGSLYYVIHAGTTKVVHVTEPCSTLALIARSPLCPAASGGERPDREAAGK